MKLDWMVGSGIDEYIADMQRLGQLSEPMCGGAIYRGAKIVADEIRQNIERLPVREESHGVKSRGVTKEQKQGLLDGFGVAPMKNDGSYVHVKIGFDGYNKKTTPNYPHGQPNAMVARFVESGNSYHEKTPFIYPAVKSSKDKAEAAMKLYVDQYIRNIY